MIENETATQMMTMLTRTPNQIWKEAVLCAVLSAMMHGEISRESDAATYDDREIDREIRAGILSDDGAAHAGSAKNRVPQAQKRSARHPQAHNARHSPAKLAATFWLQPLVRGGCLIVFS